jgi:hypothetical protein
MLASEQFAMPQPIYTFYHSTSHFRSGSRTMTPDEALRPAQAEDDEDDYLSMVIEEPQSKSKENSMQRAARLKREVGESNTYSQ